MDLLQEVVKERQRVAHYSVYSRVGHIGDFVSWVWQAGKLYTFPNTPHIDIPDDFWAPEGWHGRFDIKAKRVSVACAGGLFGSPPEPLLKALYREFGDDVELVIFEGLQYSNIVDPTRLIDELIERDLPTPEEGDWGRPIPGEGDLEVTPLHSGDPLLREGPEGGLVGYTNPVTFDMLVQVFGRPTYGTGHYERGDKMDVQWCLALPDNHVFDIYNYKDGPNYMGAEGTPVAEIQDWHVGGNHRDVQRISMALIALGLPFEPFSFAQFEHRQGAGQ